jgi:uncharacterized protein with GYD domain
MPAYMILAKFTDQGVHNAKDTVNRAKAIRQAIEKAGGQHIGVWWALGAYDVVTIAEVPNDEVAMQLLLTTGMQGNVRTETLRIFSEEEMGRIVQKLP